MQQRKSKKILIYFFLLLLVGSINNINLNTLELQNINDINIRKAKHTIELCSIYWHFLLAVWIVLFGLMLFT